MSKLIPQNFNDLLALVLVLLIPLLWILAGRGVIILPPEVLGALIVTWSLLIQYYYRKAKTEN